MAVNIGNHEKMRIDFADLKRRFVELYFDYGLVKKQAERVVQLESRVSAFDQLLSSYMTLKSRYVEADINYQESLLRNSRVVYITPPTKTVQKTVEKTVFKERRQLEVSVRYNTSIPGGLAANISIGNVCDHGESNGHYVYLMMAFVEEGYHAYKIGISKDPHKRRNSINSGSFASVVLLHTIKVNDVTEALLLESNLHHIYDKKRIKGEWFRLDDDDLESIYNFKNAGFFV